MGRGHISQKHQTNTKIVRYLFDDASWSTSDMGRILCRTPVPASSRNLPVPSTHFYRPVSDATFFLDCIYWYHWSRLSSLSPGGSTPRPLRPPPGSNCFAVGLRASITVKCSNSAAKHLLRVSGARTPRKTLPVLEKTLFFVSWGFHPQNPRSNCFAVGPRASITGKILQSNCEAVATWAWE